MREIQCCECTATLGVVSAPSKATLQKAASGNPSLAMYAGMFRFIPEDSTEIIVALCEFRCPTCTMEKLHNGEQKENSEARDSEARNSEGRFPIPQRITDDGSDGTRER